MGDRRRQEEKTKIAQPIILIAGFGLVFWWFNLAHPMAVNEDISLPAPSQGQLFIPRLAISAPIIYAVSDEEKDIQSSLRVGVVRLMGTADPGEIGNCYIVGHSSDYKSAPGDYKTVFSRLPELAAGDEIWIQTPTQTFVYEAQRTQVVKPSDLSVLSQHTAGHKLLTLQTSYPIGTARLRFLVVAEQKEK